MDMKKNKLSEVDVQHTGWAIYVVNNVLDRPNRNSYQRIIALAQGFNLVVVTNAALPRAIEDLAQEVHQVKKAFSTWQMVIRVAKELTHEGNKVYVHTQYSPNPTIAGYLCKQRTGCKWVYDLWDHPSLGYELRKKGPVRCVKRLIWAVIKCWILDKADVWIIAMHPAIMGYLPPAPVSCQVIFNQPGCNTDHYANGDNKKTDKNKNETTKIAYAGPIALQRGLDKIMHWAVDYQGPAAELNIIGPSIDKEAEIMMAKFERKCDINPNISLRVWGELLHSDAIKILRDSDIGLCPFDISILNYRFNFPIKVVEQMQLGLIVVATATHGTRTFIRDNENGILAQNEEGGMDKALDRAIRVCKDSEIKQSMRKAAMETVREHKWPLVNERLVKRLKDVLDN